MSQWIARHGWSLVSTIAAIVGLLFIYSEYEDRKDARIARAWTLIHQTYRAPGNVGQIAALESLYRDGANLWYINLHHAFLRGAQLPGADLRAAALTYADLRDADLSDADLSDADLTCADFDRADLRNTTLTGTNLTAANLREARNLTQRQLDEACANPYDPDVHKPIRACRRNGNPRGFPPDIKPPPTCSGPPAQT